jgi:hypothetical protein
VNNTLIDIPTVRECVTTAQPERSARPQRPLTAPEARRRWMLWSALVALLICASGAAGFAETSSKEQMQSLDNQVQEIKSDVLSIAAELSRLEEKLLYPSNTQVSIFVSLAEGEPLRLDWVRIGIDGQPVAHHIYTFKELEALQKGGVQRIYTGNVPTGEHQLEVSMGGALPGGGELDGTRSFSFRKEVEPKLVGIVLTGQGNHIQLGEW